MLKVERNVVSGLAFCLITLLVILNFFQMNYVGGSASADLLWNANEGYLFAHGGRSGYRVSYLGYLAEIVKEPLGVVPSADNRSSFTSVVHMTASTVERYETAGEFEYYTPVDNIIYAGHEGAVWKWMGTHFEQASSEEQRKLNGTANLSNGDFTGANGWSARRSIAGTLFDEIKIQLGGKPLTILAKTINIRDGEVSIDLLGPDRSTENLYYMTFQPRRVSRAEYEHIFGGP